MIYLQVFAGGLLKAVDVNVLPIPLIFALLVVVYTMAPAEAGNDGRKLLRSRSVAGAVLWSSGLLSLGIALGIVLTVGNVMPLTYMVIDNLDVLRIAGAVILLIFLIYIFSRSRSYYFQKHLRYQAIFEALLLAALGLWILLLNLNGFDHHAFDDVTMPLFFAVDNPRASHSLPTAFIFQLGYISGLLVLTQLLRYTLLKNIYGETIGNAAFILSGAILFALALTSIISMDVLNSVFELFSPAHGH